MCKGLFKTFPGLFQGNVGSRRRPVTRYPLCIQILRRADKGIIPQALEPKHLTPVGYSQFLGILFAENVGHGIGHAFGAFFKRVPNPLGRSLHCVFGAFNRFSCNFTHFIQIKRRHGFKDRFI